MQIDDRLTESSGTFFYSGMSMLVRLPLEQARRDHAAGLHTASLVTGYPGSPLASYDLQLAKARTLLEQHDIKLMPAGSEEQAATALIGTQMLDEHPSSGIVGVNGFWYGKGPGADRSGDAFKHGNFAGTSRHGAVVILSGEDHDAKSSTMPFQQDFAFVSAGIPILYPSSISEFRSLGLHAIAMSRILRVLGSVKAYVGLVRNGEVTGQRTPVGILPARDELNLDGVQAAPEDLDKILTIDTDRWRDEMERREHHLAQFHDLPAEIWQAHHRIATGLHDAH